MTNGLPASPSPVCSGGSGTALESAIAYIQRSIRTDGGHAAIPEGELHGYEWRALHRWAVSHSLIVPVPPARVGGREHDVLFDPDAGRWLKFTKPWSAGFALIIDEYKLMMLPATPLAYLNRWRVANRLFGEDTDLVGLYCEPAAQRIVVSQKDAQGSAASWNDIEAAFCDKLGMQRILSTDPLGAYEARAYKRGRIAVFDVRPANCVLLASGTLVPIDVIPQALSRREADMLDAITFASTI